MEPVRIRLYGILRLTRRGYLRMLACGLVLLLALWAALVFTPLPRPTVEPGLTPTGVILWLWVRDHFHWIVLAAVVAEALEAFVVLRRFAAEEARQRAGASLPPPTT